MHRIEVICMPDRSDDSTSSVTQRSAWLAATIVVMALVWLIVLPRCGRIPVIRDHLQTLEDRGIDPSAMFYTELESMVPLLERLEGENHEGTKTRRSSMRPSPSSSGRR